MNLVKIDPPGSWCHYDAAMAMTRSTGGKSFLEVGCGPGGLSLRLCEQGWHGVGIDFSKPAIDQARETLRKYIENGQYRLMLSDIFEFDLCEQFDVGISMMVMEHVQDHHGFLKRIAHFVKPGGHVIVAVPGRRDRWGIEDETVGHLRRYERDELRETLLAAGLTDVKVWSVAVPVANVLYHFSNFFIRNSAEVGKLNQSGVEQTQTSGIREIPWKTVFPPVFKLLLNRVTLYPLFILQRRFYQTNLGLTMLACGKVS